MATELFEFKWTRVIQKGENPCIELRTLTHREWFQRIETNAQGVKFSGGGPELEVERIQFVTLNEDQPGEPETYSPEDHPGLHRRFARDVHDSASALSFVRDWGFLQSSNGRPEGLNTILSVSRDMNAVLSAGGYFTKKRQNMRPAIELFNKLVSPAMTVRIDSQSSSVASLRFVPTSLLSWMWLKIAQEITRESKLIRCLTCKTEVWIDANDGREASRKFCNNPTCRQRSSRVTRKLFS